MSDIHTWTKEYLAQKKPAWSVNTHAAVEMELRRFVAFVAQQELTPKVVADYQAAQHARQCRPTTLYRSYEWVQRFLEWLEDVEYAEPNRFRQILRKPPRPYSKVKLFTHVQYEDMKDAAMGSMWYYAVVMGYRTGARYSDCALMKWECIDFDKLYIRYVPYNTD